jgi:hypothetical protein
MCYATVLWLRGFLSVGELMKDYGCRTLITDEDASKRNHKLTRRSSVVAVFPILKYLFAQSSAALAGWERGISSLPGDESGRRKDDQTI